MKPEANYEVFEQLLRASLQEQVYLGAALRKHRADEEKRNIYRSNAVVYGVPLTRIV